MHTGSDSVLVELVWTFLASYQIGSNSLFERNNHD